ncbi:MAG: response regulator [Balneolales bacterium]
MKKVLIVEDDRILSFLLSKQLKRLGYEVVGRIASGEEAIDSVKKANPDFLLMDINLEGELDGIDTMARIRSFSDIPFLYLTGNSDPNTRFRADKTRPVAYLIKPILIKDLSEVLSAALNGSASQ